jgi:hypothetical protein
MKKLLFLLAIPALGFLASCGGDDDSAPKPTITINSGAGLTSADGNAPIGSDVTFEIVALSNDKKIKNVNLTLSTNGGTAGVIADSIVGEKTVTWRVVQPISGSTGDLLTFTFTAVDDNGQSDAKSITLLVKAPTRVLEHNVSSQKVYNIQGMEPGAYDLNTETAKSSSDLDANKDLLDLTPSTAVFNKSWGSGHGTSKFAKVTSTVFTNAATTTDLEDEWDKVSATATSSVEDIATDDYILVKTGQVDVTFDIFIIKVTAVEETLSDNLDFIEFSYKGG